MPGALEVCRQLRRVDGKHVVLAHLLCGRAVYNGTLLAFSSGQLVLVENKDQGKMKYLPTINRLSNTGMVTVLPTAQSTEHSY